MKNNKGLTLVELLGVLAVLGIVVGIVTTSVTKNLKASEIELCEYQLDSLIAASQNWLTDQIDTNYDEMFTNGVFNGACVDVQQLFNGGYVDKFDGKKYKDLKIKISKTNNKYSYEFVLPDEDLKCSDEPLSRSDYCK